MNVENRLKVLQNLYVGVLVDSVRRYTAAGILDKVTEEKRNEQLVQGAQIAKSLNIQKPEEGFTLLAEITNCARWETTEGPEGIVMETGSCRLCAFAKNLATGCPCHIYCLNPMEGMLKGLDSGYDFIVEETLWHGAKCRVRIG
ncbi:hypothetical protein [Phosphitispora fastidiosa]|uniref:hypothetical protein n=1 Tax=Phosphitispora fastidiosa TaxID=2837202 RepID=UPI001E4D5556|nr:hypothetical protein [Phosphitispora fastidiosa]MBU7008421.1 hypothetical protein [Phosphitispora fastidiosa]